MTFSLISCARCVPLLAFLGAWSVAGGQGARTGSHPPAAKIVREFIAGDSRDYGPEVAVATCPDVSPYGDSLITMLLAEPQTRELVSKLTVPWSILVTKCDDPRVWRWFRVQASQARDLFLVMPLLQPLAGVPTEENLEVVRMVAFDTSRSRDVREHVFATLHRGPYAGRDEELYLEAFRRSPRLPASYAYNGLFQLLRKPDAIGMVGRLLAEVRARPDHADASQMLIILGTDAHVRATPELRAAVIRGLEEISRLPDGELSRTAAAMIGEMERARRNGGGA